MTKLPDAPARERIRSDHDTTLIVEAAAGTGKTTSVVSRVTEMVARGVAGVGEIAAVTFTERAGGELRLRIRQALEMRLTAGEGTPGPADVEERARLEQAIVSLEEAPIGTIHSFCSTLLRERPVEAGVDPDFAVLTGPEQERFYDRVFERFFEEQVKNPGPGVDRLLRRKSRFPGDSPVATLRDAGWALLDNRDFAESWRREPWDRERAVRGFVEQDQVRNGVVAPSLRRLGQLYRDIRRTSADPGGPGSQKNWLVESLAEAAMLDDEIRIREEAVGWDTSWIEQALATLQVGTWGRRPPPGAPKDLNEQRDRFRSRLERFRQWSNADLAAMLQEDLRGLVALYESQKAKAGVLDFDDLLFRARDLLRDNDEVREELQARFRHIVVDEYQDTDPIQTEIVLLLTSEKPSDGDWSGAVPRPGSICFVGDPKQSIYRFRGADVAHYLRVKERLVAAGAVELNLTSNFRSVPEICEFVNQAMAPVFEIALGIQPLARQVRYLPLHAVREPLPQGEAVRGIPMPPMKIREIEHREPKAVAEFVERLLDSGFEIPDPERRGKTRSVLPGDICLLFRRFRSWRRLVPQPYADELHDRGIPHSLNTVGSYLGSAELVFLRAAVTAIEFPTDELAVYSTLRGPLLSFSDQDLFRFLRTRGRLRPDRAAALDLGPEAPETDRQIQGALEFLFRLHRRRNHQPVAATLDELLSAHGAEVSFAFWRGSDQVLTNVRRLLEEARAFEASGGLSLRGFVERLETAAASDVGAAGPTMDEDVTGVQLLTIHGAKGLEFPVVILCDAAAARTGQARRRLDRENGIFAVELGNSGIIPWDLHDAAHLEAAEEIAELDRLLYVAMTRARDLLVSPVVEVEWAKEPRFIDPAMHELRRRPEPTLLPESGRNPLQAPSDGLRWQRRGAERWEILKSAGTAAEVEGREAAAEFAAAREAALRGGALPERRVAPAKRLAAEGWTAAAAVAVERTGRDPARPQGAGFGTLVHEVLEKIPLGANAERVEETALAAVRARDFPKDFAPHAARAVRAALKHPTLCEAAAADAEGRAWRELPLLHGEESVAAPDPRGSGWGAAGASETGAAGEDSIFESALEREEEPVLSREEGEVDLPLPSSPAPVAPGEGGPVIVHGIADLVFQRAADGPWTVVDYKTDAFDPEDAANAETLAAYRRQAALYARALTRATGREARAVLLFI